MAPACLAIENARDRIARVAFMNLTRFRLIGNTDIAWHIACSADAAMLST